MVDALYSRLCDEFVTHDGQKVYENKQKLNIDETKDNISNLEIRLDKF